jgi:hypothetical protein
MSECPDFQRLEFELLNGVVSINVPVQSFPCTYEAVGNSVIVSPRLTPVDICDQIDELVNDQLANYPQRSGYDFPVNQEKCGHCGREWHGLKITERMEEMRRLRRFDESYRYADDDSEVLCEGSEFIGPMKCSGRVMTEHEIRQLSQRFGVVLEASYVQIFRSMSTEVVER